MDDTYEFNDRLSLAEMTDIVKDITAVFKDFTTETRLELEKFDELCRYFLMKNKSKRYVRHTKLREFDLHQLLSTSSLNHNNRYFLVYIVRCQQFVTSEDFIKILAVFDLITLPVFDSLMLTEADSDRLSSWYSIDKFIDSFYDRVLVTYRQHVAMQEEMMRRKGLLDIERVHFFMATILETRFRMTDDGQDMMELSYSDVLLIFIKVYLFDYIGGILRSSSPKPV